MGRSTFVVPRRRKTTAALVVFALICAVVSALAPTAVTAAASACGAEVNAIVCENENEGTAPEIWDIEGAGDPTIQGFATDMSVDAGETIDFKIDTDADAYSIDIYRTGWYQGLGARLIDSIRPSAALPQSQPECRTEAATELYDCGTWDVSASWDVPDDAVSGVYLALLTRDDTGGASHIVFVVRRDGNTSDVLFQTSDPTWHAYNTYGGSDFYQGGANGRAYTISYNRPFATRGGIEARDFYFSSEYATVRFLERNGYDTSYIAGVDTHRRGGELLNHGVFLSVGHDEYWSGAQRAAIETARDAGVHLQFLTGNEGYWRTRYEDSPTGTDGDGRTLVSYKETWGDSWHPGGGKIDPSAEWTGTWRDPRFAGPADGGRSPENALTGTMYMVNYVGLPVTVTAAEGKTRLWRNTGLDDLPAGTEAALADRTVGYESNEDIDNGRRPPGLIRLSTTVGEAPEYLRDYGNAVSAGETEHHVTLYRAPSGALVFSAASIQWGWGLDDTHDGDGPPADRRMQQAQVNLFADMGVQPGTLQDDLVAATAGTDETPPTTVIASPAEGAELAHGSSVVVTGTAGDADGVVAGVEVSTDGGASWHPAEGTTQWTYTYIQQGLGEATIIARAIDDSANFAEAGTTRHVEVTGAASVLGEAVPDTASADDAEPVEVGLRFTPEVDGFVTGVRFYRGPANTAPATGSVWDATGQRLAEVEFPAESVVGWRSAALSAAVPVIAGQQYTVSYTAPEGGYAMTPRYWPYRAQATSPLVVSHDAGSGAAGVYGSAGQFPASTWDASQYSVDVVFEQADSSPVRIVGRSPAAGAASVAHDTEITATFSRAVVAGGVSLAVTDASSNAVAGATSYDEATRTARFTPAQPLAPETTYTVAPLATDAEGVALAAGSGWSFTTRAEERAEGDCPCRLFLESSVPAMAAAPDTDAVTLGVAVTPDTDGTVTTLMFYKGQGNTGTHIGTLWDAGGAELSSVEFAGESAQGWQSAALDAPVEVSAGETYVVSYTAPAGRYAATPGAFAGAYERGPLAVAASGARYSYSGGFPTQPSTTDYGVDVVFEPDPLRPEVVERHPGAGETVAGDAVVSLVYSLPLESAPAGDGTAPVGTAPVGTAPVGTAPVGTVTANGAAVAGTWELDAAGTTLAFAPDAQYPAGAQIIVSVRGVRGVDGEPAADEEWSFEIAPAQPPLTLLGGAVPDSVQTSETDAVELGMAFSSTVDGAVTAIRFYQVEGDTAAHTGTLWDDTGAALADIAFTTSAAAGWRRAVLAQPVPIVAGRTYTVSYHSAGGRYAYTSGGFAGAISSGPLTAPAATNGRYRYGAGGAVPTSVWQATNYFVDVEFAADDEPDEPGGTG